MGSAVDLFPGHWGGGPCLHAERNWLTAKCAREHEPERVLKHLESRKGQQWYFGMKMHIGVDSQPGLMHSALVTAANVHDRHPLSDLLHSNERRVYGDSAYSSQKNLIAGKVPHAKDFTNARVRNRLGEVDEVKRSKNSNKSRIRARVEHVFCVVKRLASLRVSGGTRIERLLDLPLADNRYEVFGNLPAELENAAAQERLRNE